MPALPLELVERILVQKEDMEHGDEVLLSVGHEGAREYSIYRRDGALFVERAGVSYPAPFPERLVHEVVEATQRDWSRPLSLCLSKRRDTPPLFLQVFPPVEDDQRAARAQARRLRELALRWVRFV